MLTKPEKSTLLTDFILDYSENRLTGSELSAFKELMNSSKVVCKAAVNGKNIRRAMATLPKRKVSKRFDQKMAARFAMELERETTENNAKRVGNRSISAI
ncbi:hypothetical protein [Rhodohalobacter sp.]|uniref:hypothetical protein n=1 Tax=Rhodohalobacter sp. TaxID=1974210 RepID=UPI002ACEAD73|nr:hypothetical protein [Rhodohalobacter sp.]MDZ7757332.1 hypothetical protein [Rhodohalobacter sp.]